MLQLLPTNLKLVKMASPNLNYLLPLDQASFYLVFAFVEFCGCVRRIILGNSTQYSLYKQEVEYETNMEEKQAKENNAHYPSF